MSHVVGTVTQPCELSTMDELIRKSWPSIWMNIAKEIAEGRSYDVRLKVGCVIVPEDNTGILSIGYNGNAKGLPNEAESLEPGQSGFLHAELNSLIKCDFNNPKKKIMYVTHFPCPACSKAIINANIHRVVYDSIYRDMEGKKYFDAVGIQVRTLQEAIVEAESRM